MSDYLKSFSKSIKENENMSFKNKVLMGGWISTVARVFRRDKNMLAILKGVKNRYHGKIMFVAIVKLVTNTLLCRMKSAVNNNRYLL